MATGIRQHPDAMGRTRGSAGPGRPQRLPRRCLPPFLQPGRGRGTDPGCARQRASAIRRLRDGPLHLGGRHVHRLLRGRLHGQRIRHHGSAVGRGRDARHRRRVLRVLQRLMAGGPGLVALPRPVPLGVPGGVARNPCGEPRGARRLRRGNRRGYAHRRCAHRGRTRKHDDHRRAERVRRAGHLAPRRTRERPAPQPGCEASGRATVECGVPVALHVDADPRGRGRRRGAGNPAGGLPAFRDRRLGLHAQRPAPDLLRLEPP